MSDITTAVEYALAQAAEDYRRAIVAARCSMSSEDYGRCNGHAEATRITATNFATAAGLPMPDWDAIRTAVPADGIYRKAVAS